MVTFETAKFPYGRVIHLTILLLPNYAVRYHLAWVLGPDRSLDGPSNHRMAPRCLRRLQRNSPASISLEKRASACFQE